MRSAVTTVAAVATLLVSVAAACSGGQGSTAGSDDAIDVFGPYRGVEADHFAASLQDFEDATGIEVDYTGSADFVTDLRRRLESGLDAPDIAVVPQPGVVAELVERDLAVELDPATVAAIDEHYGERAEELTRAGAGYMAPYRISPKSLVWYRPDVFAEHGWTVPTTLGELAQLVEQIAGMDADGTPMAPWCFTMAAGSATGWAATDWVEDIVLQTAGSEVYDQWTTGALDWDDAAIRDAMTTFDELVVATGRNAGGLRSILLVDVTEASEPMFDDPAGCALYKQASFAESWFPDGTDIGDDVDFFVFPSVTDDEPASMLVGADGLVQFSDDDRVDQLMTFLVSPDGGRAWAERGGYLSGRTSVDIDTYYSVTDRRFAELLLDGRELRFDASDLLPPEIGADLLWTEISAWVAGASSLDQFVSTIDDAIASLAAAN
jgi:alpha-glucoside transport system substrate-binding protein